MKYKDLPPRNTIVRIVWQDSGMCKEPGVKAHVSDMGIGKDELFGRIVRRSRKRNEVTIAYRKPYRGKLDPVNDFYHTCTVDSIAKMFVLEPVKELS